MSVSILVSLFQSTLPREERPWILIIMIIFFDFNPRSHERSDCHNSCMAHSVSISIHAPTRGATHARHNANCYCIKFQSTLPREERRFRYLLWYRLQHFNPRSHERSDSVFFSFCAFLLISIHAPTRGATLLKYRQ